MACETKESRSTATMMMEAAHKEFSADGVCESSRLRFVFLAFSIALYVTALFLPAYFGPGLMYGIQCLLTGWFLGPLMWMANPILWAAWWLCAISNRGTLGASVVALFFGAFLLMPLRPENFFVGSYLWYGSMLLAIAGGTTISLTKRPIDENGDDTEKA